jgi:hypothetical protein
MVLEFFVKTWSHKICLRLLEEGKRRMKVGVFESTWL